MIKFAVLLFSGFIATANAAVDNQFNHFFNALDSFSANFSQSSFDANQTLINTVTGSVLFARPKQLRWHITSPNEQILLLNNQQLWSIDIALEQAVLQTSNISNTPLYWLINKPNTLAHSPVFSHQTNGVDWYQAPKTSPDYHNLLFAFKAGSLDAISLVNNLGQKIVIHFSQLKINPVFNSQAFQLNLDPSFDIIK